MSVDKRPNGTYRVRWREYPGAPQQTRTFRTAKAANKFDTDTQHSLQHGIYSDPALGAVALVVMLAEFIDRQPWRENTRRSADYALERVKAYFGEHMPIGQVRTSHLQAFVSALDVEPRTAATIWRFPRSMFRAAHIDGVIGRDPCLGVKLPRHEGGEIVVPTIEDVATLRSNAPTDFAVAITLGAMLGLRSSEAAGLTVDRVDFLRREVRVDRQWHGRLDRFDAVKSASSNRVIPAGDRALEQIAWHIEHHGAGQHGVLLHADGRPLNSNRMDWRWERTAKDVRPDLTFHTLRHHYASSLLSSGRCSIVAAQRALGHSAASITLDTYGHLMPSDSDRIRSAIDEAWNSAEDSLRIDDHREAR